MHSLVVWLLLRSRHYLRVVVVALCVLTFLAGADAAHSDRLGVALGALV
jgi:hypothetical protein